jgi:hypothetical protein
MTSNQLSALVDRLKRKQRVPGQSVKVKRPRLRSTALSTPYDDGVNMAKETLQEFEKELEKIK